MSQLVTVGQAFQQGLPRGDVARRDDLCTGTDLFIRGGHFAQVKGIGPEFGPERVLDTPISEAAMVAAGVGAALNGMRPVVDLNFIDFAFGAMDEIVNQAARPLSVGQARATGHPGLFRHRPLRGPAQQQPRVVVHAHAGPACGDAVECGRHQRDHQVRAAR